MKADSLMMWASVSIVRGIIMTKRLTIHDVRGVMVDATKAPSAQENEEDQDQTIGQRQF